MARIIPRPRPGRRTVLAAVSIAALGVLLAGSAGAASSASTTGPAVTLTPASLTFGEQATGTTSAPQSVTVANTGTASLFINSAQVRGADPLDFTEVDDGCSGLTLPPGGSCNVAVNFSPTTTGTRSATLIVIAPSLCSPVMRIGDAAAEYFAAFSSNRTLSYRGTAISAGVPNRGLRAVL